MTKDQNGPPRKLRPGELGAGFNGADPLRYATKFPRRPRKPFKASLVSGWIRSTAIRMNTRDIISLRHPRMNPTTMKTSIVRKKHCCELRGSVIKLRPVDTPRFSCGET